MTGKALVAILGPTATGKTGLAIELAQRLNGEIIGADSRQIYRHMDIGTAKPTPQQQAQVPHHLIDIVDPDENLTAAEFQDRAYAAIDDVLARGRLPLLVGGTGQYISAVTEGWTFPRVPPNPALRADLEAFAAEQGPEALHSRLAAGDPDAAGRIHPNNVRRVVRALEVLIETGRPISEQQRRRPPPYHILLHGLTMPRELLYERADRRIGQMMEEGFLDEVRLLLEMGYSRSLPSMSGLGYLELSAHLQGELTLEEALERTRFATHDFIRRQYVWFRGHNQGIVWHNVEHGPPAELFTGTARWLQEQN